MTAPARWEAVVGGLDQLPALPEVVVDLLDYLRGSEVDAGQLAHKIARDPALATKLLRVANSSFYGLQSQVASVQDALVVLGLRAVGTLVTAAAIVRHCQALAATSEDQRTFWRHCGGTAICARVLARRVGISPESAYTAGLLHDLGRLILMARFPRAFAEILTYRAAHDCYRVEAEREVLGFDHAQVGAALVTRWKFPAEIVAAIAFHHGTADQPAASSSLVDVVHVADAMAHILGFPNGEEDLVPPLSAKVWHSLGIGWEEFKRLLGEADGQRDDVELMPD